MCIELYYHISYLRRNCSMWGEAVEAENIFSRVWVRASGTSEKLWSPMDFTVNFDVDAAGMLAPLDHPYLF